MKRVLYLTRNGLLEPLGQSQILSYLVPLSKEYKFYIVSFEKEKDYDDVEHYDRIKSICKENNIHWKPLHYKKGNRKVSVILGFFELIKTCVRIIKREKIDVIHARSYFPAFIAFFLNKIYKTPFIFDMRALWPEELVEAGRLKSKGFVWRGVKILEKKCLKKSIAVVSLTKAAVEYLDKTNPSLNLTNKTTVIPTCADLDRFKISENQKKKDRIVLSCVGSMLTGWFKLNILKEVIHYILENYENVYFEFLTRDNRKELLSKLALENKYSDRVVIDTVLFKDMPNRIATHNGSVFFFTANISKLGSAPTRMAELLGVGIPVLTNSGVGDVGAIVNEHKIGVLIDSNTSEEIKKACDSFMNLVNQEGIANKCRETALQLFSLESGVKKYRKIYEIVPSKI